MFPKKHSFSYSYLAVGVPVDWEGNAGGMVSVGVEGESGLSSWFSLAPRTRQGWYTIDAGDYLERGNSKLGLRGKLDTYLRSQGTDPTLFPHAYLITAARFLGYHFNPVSFWYLYDADRSLAAMILEVNNTFDERRMYFLTADNNDELVKQIDGLPGSRTDKEQLVTNMRQSAPSGATFKQSWPKDFHVSPFNSRKGSYSLTASDPLSPLMQGTGPVVNTINLVSSKGHGKLVARLIPEGAAINPYTMTPYGKFIFLASWWWVGFLTFPRIVKEAGALFFRRKLHVWFRPEPLKESIGRNADVTELQLEPIFRRYLRHLVEQSTVPLTVKYIPSGVPGIATELMISRLAQDGKGKADEIVFKVLTPAFYSRFVHYAHDFEAVFCELQESCTIWVSHPELLPRFVLKKPSPTLASSNYAEFAYFKILQYLRVRPERIVRPLTSSAAVSEGGPERLAVDIRNFRISSMDAYVLAHETGQAKAVYRSSVLKLFLADRIALGMVPLLELERLALQTWFAWRLSSTVAPVLTSLSHYVRGQSIG
ncbi:hypothetical protein B0T25DRAFT_565187 [Lasiosphaeria hispida]|uniref:DNA-binding WRKY domain-containing protein n=1 Tax=Lasiosphaeria hispida TaxID=260671 RepID=A0AAJ0HSB6_9PEZI|nr:hypothetical protein B0T25DRAFT_565187 [Lasiosphaeria hispida]